MRAADGQEKMLEAFMNIFLRLPIVTDGGSLAHCTPIPYAGPALGFFYNWRKPFILATALPSVQCRSGEMDYDIFVKEKLLLGKWGKIHTSWKGR